MQLSVFEAMMLLCFGAAWPINIAKTLKSRSSKGKSGLFLAVILAGYLAGITHKLLYSPDLVLALYILNFTMVSADFILFLHFRRKEKQQG